MTTQTVPTTEEMILLLTTLPQQIAECETRLLAEEIDLMDGREGLQMAEDLFLKAVVSGKIEVEEERLYDALLRDDTREDRETVGDGERTVMTLQAELSALKTRFEATLTIARLLAVRTDR